MQDTLTHELPVAPSSSQSPLVLLARAAWVQALRRREIYVIGILLGLYLLGAVVLRIVGISSAQSARFIADLGLELGGALAALLVIVLGTRQMPEEIELRTIYPILAKPLTRVQLLVGKAFPTWAAGAVAFGLFAVVTLAVTPRLPYQQAPMLAQAVLFKAAALAMLTALTFWLSLWLPAAVAALGAIAVCFGGSMAGNLAIQAASGSGIGRILAALIPDFSMLQLTTRYIDGGAPLGWAATAGLLLYAGLWMGIFGWLAIRRFGRMAL